jgi:hypothetical protein
VGGSERGSVAVVLLVLLVITVLAGATVERAISASRSGRAEQDRLLVRSALDIGVAEATAKLDAGQTGPFTGSGTLSTGASWWYHAAPVSGGYRVTAAASAGTALRQQGVVVSRTTAGGWAPSSTREAAPSPYALAVLSTPGLQAYWRLDETTSSSFADASGNGLSAAISGGVSLNQAGALSASGDGNGAASFNGVDSIAVGPDALAFDGRVPFTVSAWMRPAGSGDAAQYVVVREATVGGLRNSWALGWNLANGQPYLLRVGNDVIERSFAGAPITVGAWSHVVAAYDGTTARIYVDGVLSASPASTVSISPVAAAVSLGKGISNTRFNGTSDEVAVWNRSLAATEVARLYAAGTSGTVAPPTSYSVTVMETPGLLGYWRLVDTGGTTAADASGRGMHGTYSGGFTLGGPTAMADGTGGSVALNGSDGQVALPADVVGVVDGEITVTAWVRTTDADAPVVSMRRSGFGNPVLDFHLGNNGVGNVGTGRPTVLLRDDGGGGTVAFTSPTAVNSGQWVFLAYTRTTAKLNTIYVDGVAVVTGTDTVNTITTDLVRIGREPVWGAGGTANLAGDVQDVAIWSRALTATEIATLHSRATQPGA